MYIIIGIQACGFMGIYMWTCGCQGDGNTTPLNYKVLLVDWTQFVTAVWFNYRCEGARVCSCTYFSHQ